MTAVKRQVRSAKHRLWLNHWLRDWGWWLLAATVVWTLLWLLGRLFAWQLPAGWFALAALGASLLGATASFFLSREQERHAAAVLDEAAGLKERISSGLYVQDRTDDPFAQAVVADAQNAIAGLSARAFIPIRWPGSLSASAIMLLVALGSLLLPEFDLLGRREAQAEARAKEASLKRVRTAVARPVSAIRKVAETSPDAGIDQDLKALQEALKRETDPDVLRRETVKKLDRMEDALKQKVDNERIKALSETRKRLRQLGQPADAKGELARLMASLSSGEFDKAQDSLKKLQQELAKRARGTVADKQQVEQMRNQLDELGKKLDEVAKDKQTERELKNAGLSEADMKRVLEALAKKDTKQLEKLTRELSQRLKDKGFSQEQLQKMLEKMRQRQAASQQCRQMADKMNKAARDLEKGDTQAAQDELGEAAEMLSEMEQLEQSLNDLEGQLAELAEARWELEDTEVEDDLTCRKCNGTGFRKDGAPCPHCNGTGSCGNRGRGQGARDRDDSAEVAFEDRKVKGRDAPGGRIISQQFVKGSPLKNRSQIELQDAARAAEIDASDALEKDRIPRIYRRGVKTYFDRLGDDFRPDAQAAPGGAKDPPADVRKQAVPARPPP